MDAPREQMTPIDFQVAKFCTVIATKEWIIHYMYATLLNFAPGGI